MQKIWKNSVLSTGCTKRSGINSKNDKFLPKNPKAFILLAILSKKWYNESTYYECENHPRIRRKIYAY